jgi:hypothetical protein
MSVVIHGRFIDLMDAATTLRRQYRAAWLAQYTDYRLGTALGRWDVEYAYWREFQARLLEVAQNFKKGDTLPPLQELDPHLLSPATCDRFGDDALAAQRAGCD